MKKTDKTSTNFTIEDYNTICDAHQEESLWYFFLGYGDPLNGSNLEYAMRFDAVRGALEDYVDFITKQQELLHEERELYL